jgi:SAM-dependent methyltransferase
MEAEAPPRSIKQRTKEYLDSQFSAVESRGSDRWLIRYRASQTIRHDLCYSMTKEVCNDKKAMRILDIGCALGEFTARFCAVNNSHHIVGIDISFNAVQYASKMYPRVTFLQGALPDLGFEDTTFDLVILLEVLCYFTYENRQKVIGEIYRSMAPGGYLLLSSRLDDGTHYFTSEEVQSLISNQLHVKEISYNHARIYTVFEKPFLLAYTALDVLSGEHAMEEPDENMSKAKRAILSIGQMALAKRAARLVAPTMKKSILWILKYHSAARLFFWLDKAILGKNGGSHIIILAQKPVDP